MSKTQSIRTVTENVKWIQEDSSSLFALEESLQIHSSAQTTHETISPSDHDKLFGCHQKAPTWASFEPPPCEEESAKKCFNKQLIKDFSLDESLIKYENTASNPILSDFFSLYNDLSSLMETIQLNKARYCKG